MQLGVCGSPALAQTAAGAGFEYLEGTVGGLLKPREPEPVFREALDAARNAPLPCPVVNCFVPGDLKITGPDADFDALTDYVAVTMQRALEAGVDTIVFGSGGARSVPEGTPRERAREQIAAFCAMAAPLAQTAGVTLVIEPLQRSECNILTTVGESADLLREIDHPNLKLLVDAFHWLRDDDSARDLEEAGPLLRHAHIATRENRRAPGAEPCDFGAFFRALKAGGYNGRLSFEGRLENPDTELPRAFEVLREAIANA